MAFGQAHGSKHCQVRGTRFQVKGPKYWMPSSRHKAWASQHDKLCHESGTHYLLRKCGLVFVVYAASQQTNLARLTVWRMPYLRGALIYTLPAPNCAMKGGGHVLASIRTGATQSFLYAMRHVLKRKAHNHSRLCACQEQAALEEVRGCVTHVGNRPKSSQN